MQACGIVPARVRYEVKCRTTAGQQSSVVVADALHGQSNFMRSKQLKITDVRQTAKIRCRTNTHIYCVAHTLVLPKGIIGSLLKHTSIESHIHVVHALVASVKQLSNEGSPVLQAV